MVKLEKQFSWDKTWKGRKSQISLTHKVIWRKLCEYINLNKKSYLEIGAGTGVFGKLSLEAGATRVCLLDSSTNAIKMCREYIRDDPHVSFVLSDVISFKSKEKFDIVLSNGLIEHFSGKEQELIVKAHVNNSKDKVVILAPASPHFNDRRCQYPWALKNYGFQAPITIKKMRTIFREANLESIFIERFYPLYSIKINRLFPVQNNLLALIDFFLIKIGFYHLITWLTNPLGKWFGGYIIAIGKVHSD